ncbi:MAG: hypothetical protein RBS37_00250 [Bacteroidales bacterium]|jgi:hypothetical protein|nr:hypothetical protein [Bacteroidales bacterium]
MILVGLIQSVTRGNRSNGLEAVFQPDGGVILNYVGIKKQGGVICVEKAEQFHTVADFLKVADKKYPVYLSYDGRGVLHRQYSASKADYDIGDLHVRSSETDVVEQTVNLNDGSMIKSYTRRDRVAELLDELTVNGYYVFQIILGPFACRVLAETDNLEGSITIPGYRLQYTGGILTGFTRTEDYYTKSSFMVEGKEISLDFMIAFANSVCHFQGITESGIDYPLLSIRTEEFRYKNMIGRLKLPFLICCFVALVLNYLIYERHRTSNAKMRNELAGEALVIKGYERLASILDQKERYLSSSGYYERTLISYYSDRIAGSIPDGLKITRMTFSPEDKKVPGVSDVTYTDEIIKIFGFTESGIALNRWIQSLNEFEWIEDVRILGYSNQGNDPADFNIEIKMSGK